MSTLLHQHLYGSSLYVGNLDPRVCTELLEEIFSLCGKVTLCKVVGDKVSGKSLGFGFVDYESRDDAIVAMEKFNGRTIFGKEIKVDWAHTGTGAAGKFVTPGQSSDEFSGHFCVFIGNLSPDVDDELLVRTFAAYISCTSAKIAKDPDSNRPAGYGFATFRDKRDAEAVIQAWNGKTLGQKVIRVDWAKSKNGTVQQGELPSTNRNQMNPADKSLLDYDTIFNQTSMTNCMVYIAGLSSTIDEAAVMGIFAGLGNVENVKIPDSSRSSGPDRAYAFVRFSSHAEAARAIYELQGREVNGKKVTLSWGRETRPQPMAPFPNQGFPPVSHGHPFQGGYQRPLHDYPQMPPPGPMMGGYRNPSRPGPY